MPQVYSLSNARRIDAKRYRQKLGQARLLETLAAENKQLRDMLAELTLQTQRLRDVLGGGKGEFTRARPDAGRDCQRHSATDRVLGRAIRGR